MAVCRLGFMCELTILPPLCLYLTSVHAHQYNVNVWETAVITLPATSLPSLDSSRGISGIRFNVGNCSIMEPSTSRFNRRNRHRFFFVRGDRRSLFFPPESSSSSSLSRGSWRRRQWRRRTSQKQRRRTREKSPFVKHSIRRLLFLQAEQLIHWPVVFSCRWAIVKFQFLGDQFSFNPVESSLNGPSHVCCYTYLWLYSHRRLIWIGMKCHTHTHGEGQLTAIMDLIEARREELVGEMPLKICYPAIESHEQRIMTGCDPKNTRWSYHNGGSWPGRDDLVCVSLV